MLEHQNISEVLERVLIEIEQTQKLIKHREKPFLTIDEASDYLVISKATLYGYTSKNIIPFYKLQDRRLYFKISDLDEWILSAKNRNRSNDEIKCNATTKILKDKSQAQSKVIL